MKAYQMTLDIPMLELRCGDQILVLDGRHEGETGIVSVPPTKYYGLSIVSFKGRNNTESLKRSQVFILKRKKY